MNIVVLGANGPTGKIIVQAALNAGHQVRAVTRHPAGFAVTHERLRVLRADVSDQGQATAAVAGQDAVLSSLGTTYSWRRVTVFSKGTGNLVRAMREAGVRRLACVSSTLADPETRYHDTGAGPVFEKVVKPLLATTIGRTSYDDMQRMEALVAASGLDWTVVRAGGLFASDTVTDYRVQESVIGVGSTSRADLADFLLRQAGSPEWVGRIAAIGTVTGAPSIWQIFRREAFQPQK